CAVSIFYPVSTNVNKCIDCLSRSKYKGLFACAVGKLPDNFRLPVVYIDQGFSYSGHNHVICNDNYQGAFNMMQAVLSKGHRNVLISSTANEYIEDNRQQRLLGFTAAMKENGLLDTQQRQLKLAHNLSFATRCSIIKENIHRFGNISAIVTDSDNDAFTIMSVLHALGMEDRICVTGFGNIEVITKMYNLPSVEQFPQEMGIRAAMKMLSICRGEANASSLTEIETQLVNVEKIPEARN
ncbi:MAG: substrate-binding domain-containing protein, partial [Victivallales bacterium]|nr:substrate-binding domain-containing protein [Victivallales bacterium]